MEQKLGESLTSRLRTSESYETFDVDVFLRDEPDEALSHLSNAGFADGSLVTDGPSVVNLLKKHAAANQRGVIDFLREAGNQSSFIDNNLAVPKVHGLRSFWINNSLGVEVTREVLEQLEARPDVVHIESTHYADTRTLIDAPEKGSGRRFGERRSGPRAREFDGEAGLSSFHAGVLDFVFSGLTLEEFNRDETADAPQPTWSVKRVNAPLLWQLGLSGEDVVVAVVDSGVNYNHPDLKSHMWDKDPRYPHHGFDFASNDDDPFDEGIETDGHGTACAGIVAGDGTSGKITGVAPKAQIMAVRVGGAERSFWSGLQFAVDHGAKVISMSMTWKYPSHPNYPGWRRTCETLFRAGILHANSIGNQGNDLVNYPIPFNIAAPGNCPPPRLHPLQTLVGNLSSTISCGATDDSDRLAFYSGRGPAAWETSPYSDYPFQNGAAQGLIKPDICAPGPGTESCNWRFTDNEPGKPYRSFGGTSAATPHVGGCLALLAQACLRSNKPIMPDRIQEALENTAVRIPGQIQLKESHFGAGRIDIFAAFNYGRTKGWWA